MDEASRARLIHLIPQGGDLLAASVRENLGLTDANADDARLLRALEKARTGILPDQETQTLSGGERQRVAVAGGFLTQAAVILLDEPTSALDAKTALELMENICRLAHEEKRVVIMVTHDPQLARLADRHVHLEGNAAGLWGLAGTVEAAACVALAWSILHHASPGYMLLWGILSVATTVLVQRSSFHAGVRFASTLYGLLGQALSRAKLSWFTEEHRALVATVARRSIPGLMSVPPHQISAFLYAVLMPCLLVAGTAWMLDGHTAAVMAVLLAVSFGIQVAAQRALLRVDAGRGGVEQAAARASLEFLEHVELLRSVAGTHRALERVEARWDEEERALGDTARIATWAMVWAGVATALPLAGILMFMSAGQQADAASGLAVIVLVLRASAPLDALAHAGLGIGNLVTGLRHVAAGCPGQNYFVGPEQPRIRPPACR